MQSYDENNNLLKSQALENMEQLGAEMKKPEVKHVTVGKLPQKGEVYVINGLKFVVKGVERKTGAVTFKILQPNGG